MSPETPALTAYEQLTDKQRAFVDALCLEPNISGTQAAINAGYNKKGAAVEAHHCLRNPKVRLALGERLKDVAPTSQEIAIRWDRVSRATLDDFYTKRRVKVENKVKQPLAAAIAEEEAAHAFEAKVAARQQLNEAAQAAFNAEQQHRRNSIIRMQVELEENPASFRLVNGPDKFEDELVLDLVKAQKAGVLDLARAIKPTAHGTGIELRDPDAALDKLARMAGAYEKDNEQSRPIVGDIGVTIKRAAPVQRREAPARG